MHCLYSKSGPDVKWAIIKKRVITNMEKQKIKIPNIQISKDDSVSTLGRLFQGNRKERRKQGKVLKRKLKHPEKIKPKGKEKE